MRTLDQCGRQIGDGFRDHGLQLSSWQCPRRLTRLTGSGRCRHRRAPLVPTSACKPTLPGKSCSSSGTPWRDGTTHLVLRRDTNSPVDRLCQPKGLSSARVWPARLSPLEFTQRLAALMPRPGLHLVRFGMRITSLCEVRDARLREHRVLAPNARLRAQVVPQEPEPPAQGAPPAECEATCAHRRPVRLSWAKLLKRVFEIDMEHCPNRGADGVR